MKLLFRSTGLLLVILLIAFQKASSKSPDTQDSLVIGKPLPAIILKNILYYKNAQVNSKSLVGKWLILDFWSRGCTVCVERFPVMNDLNLRYHDQLQVFLVGKPGYGIQKMYEKFRQKENLTLPISYDSSLFKKFHIRIVPYVIVVDPRGIVRAITIKIGEDEFKSFLNGNEPMLQSAKNTLQEEVASNEFDLDKPLFIDNNGGSDTAFLFRSVLGRWTKSMPVLIPDLDGNISFHKNRMQMTGLTIAGLYKVAYGDTIQSNPFRKINSYGKFWPHAIVDVKDTLRFKPDFLTGDNLYCYSQSAIPGKMSSKEIQARMRMDLQNYFGFEVKIEVQKKPVWNLVIIADSSKNLLPARDTFSTVEIDVFKGPLQDLPAAIWYNNPELELVYDETGLDKKRWLQLDNIMTNLEELRRGLKKYGMDLRPAEKEVKVIVLSD